MVIILPHQPIRNLQVIDVMEDEGAAVGVDFLVLEEVQRVVAPVAAGVQVMGGVVAVIEAVAV